jgi:hypothetical protein
MRLTSYYSKIFSFIGIIVMISIPFYSCKKFVEIEPPKDYAVAATIFDDDQSAISAVAGLYSQLTSSELYITHGGTSVFCGLAADEIINTANNSTYDPFKTNSLTANNSVITNRFYNRAYIYIYHANAIITGLSKASTVTPAVSKQLMGEAKCLRAFLYFYLVNLYGDIPLITSTDYKTNATLPRASKETIYKQVTEDLLEAIELLPSAYPTGNRARINKWAAYALLSRVYLFTRQWAEAESSATSVINAGVYSLVPLNNVFLPSSSETIWQIAPPPATNSAEGSAFLPSSGTARPTFALTSYLLADFEPGDQRNLAGNWIRSNINGGQTYYYPYKYKVKSAPSTQEYNIAIRLAEILLIRAEAFARQGKIEESQADLNAVRTRAGLTNTLAGSEPALLDAILHERRTELFTEWGHRWFDLKRIGKIDMVLSAVKGTNWQSTDSLWPIPFAQIQLNSFLTQNEGY